MEEAMFVLLNGSFGIGKTTTAKALSARFGSSTIYDPEPLGIAMQRISAYIRPQGRISDFQELKSWRRLISWSARRRHRRFDPVIVPMAFSNLYYFEELAVALSETAPVHKLCLVAPLQVVRERLEKRAKTEGTAVDDWAVRRAEECCHAHQSPAFGHPIDATVSTAEIVQAVTAYGITNRRR